MDELQLRELIDQAFAALSAEDYVRGVAIADQLAASAPDRAVIRAIRAQALLGANAPDESFQEARRAVGLDPTDSYAQRLLAMTAWRTGRLNLAQESYQTAIRLSDRRPALLNDYAWFMAMERGPKPAEQAARAAIAADADSSTAWAALGMAQLRQHRRVEAEASLRRALQLNPNDLYAQSAMVTLLQHEHDDAKAEALAGLIEEHAGTEELVAAVREESKRRRIAAMLVERNVDLNQLIDERRSYRWIWLLAAGALVAMLVFPISHWLSSAVLVLTLFLVVAMRRWLE
ncbi:MAG: tetratricopeptide repeat protein [Planctomycetaceae bacterium]|nr:tetratricopeptide repeat protein [Planctomycetaceae bacterium]